MTPASWREPAPSDRGDGHGATEAPSADCSSLLAAADAALVVTLRTRPRSWLAAHDCTRDVAFLATYPHPDCYRTFSDPGDAVSVALAVDEWQRSLPDEAVPAVCLAGFDSLVEYAGRHDARRFLQVVTGRVRAADGTVHCHSGADAPAASPDGLLLDDTNRFEYE